MMPIATVAISQALEPRRANGRMPTHSTTMPYTPHSASEAAAARPSGQPSPTAKA